MRKFITYMKHWPKWKRIQAIPRGLATDYEPGDVDRDTANLMSLMHVRCPQVVRRFAAKHNMTPREAWLTLGPGGVRRRQWKRRFMSLIYRNMGTTPYDPMLKYRPRGRTRR